MPGYETNREARFLLSDHRLARKRRIGERAVATTGLVGGCCIGEGGDGGLREAGASPASPRPRSGCRPLRSRPSAEWRGRRAGPMAGLSGEGLAAFAEALQGQAKTGGVHAVAAGVRDLDVVHDEALDEVAAVGLIEEMTAHLERDHRRDVLVFGNRVDFLDGQLTDTNAIFVSQHGNLPSSLAPGSAHDARRLTRTIGFLVDTRLPRGEHASPHRETTGYE